MTLRPLYFFIAAFLLIVVSLVAGFKSGDADFASAKELIVMREIGHEILLSSRDSSSRVLPVKKIEENKYQIEFASTLQFTPDSIVRIIQHAVETNKLPGDYIVNVVECQKNQVIFGYAILQTEQTNLVPCKGRPQPKACYSIHITFRNTGFSSLTKNYLIKAGGWAALMLVLSGLTIGYRQKGTDKTIEQEAPAITSAVISIGGYQFHSEKQYLECNTEQIQLSEKESKLLYILASKPNSLIERSVLQKVWEDEGVIVDRSLDMFISKLRKKLQSDSSVKLVNIHGKGYKLEINKG
ncbi:MAG: transcriptional regulator, winged helix family [Sphingobacteriales bacterium]|nr:transcriptional regulator, winged helix family [Sphingobacteriales bacterium]